MKTTVTVGSFIQAFSDCNRAENFSYNALECIFDYLEEYEDQTGEEIELDVIAICCEFSEINLKDLKNETGCESPEELQEKTIVLYHDDVTVLYQVF